MKEWIQNNNISFLFFPTFSGQNQFLRTILFLCGKQVKRQIDNFISFIMLMIRKSNLIQAQECWRKEVIPTKMMFDCHDLALLKRFKWAADEELVALEPIYFRIDENYVPMLSYPLRSSRTDEDKVCWWLLVIFETLNDCYFFSCRLSKMLFNRYVGETCCFSINYRHRSSS